MKYGALVLLVIFGVALTGCGDDDLFEHRASGDPGDSDYTMLKGVGRSVDPDQAPTRNEPH